MAEKQPVSEGEDLTVTVQDIEDSDWGSLTYGRQKIFPTERRDIILSQWIQEEKNDFLGKTGREWSYFIADSKKKTKAFQTIVRMVGLRILNRAHAARLDTTDASYSSQIEDLEAAIEKDILNFRYQYSPATVSNGEPDLVDPDSDYSYND